MRREISLHGSNPNRLSSSPMRQRRPKPDGAAVAWVLSFSAYSRKLSAALPIARFYPIWDRCAAATGRLSAASRFRTSSAAFNLPAASTFQEVVRRLHGSFQFPTVLALHLYLSGTLPILLNAFSGLRLDRAAPCGLLSQETVCGCAETARPFSGHLARYGSELGLAEYYNGAAFGLAEG